jgi:DNA-binding MarR family transcriptional regulator
MAHDAAGAAFTDLVLLTFRLNGALLRAGDSISAPVGQTSARWQVMGVIDQEAKTVAAIAREMGLARQSVQRTADLLVEEGLAAFHDNPAHKRAKLVRLTAHGREALEVIEEAQRAWANRVGSAVSTGDIAAASAVLRRLLDALEADEAQTARPSAR